MTRPANSLWSPLQGPPFGIASHRRLSRLGINGGATYPYCMLADNDVASEELLQALFRHHAVPHLADGQRLLIQRSQHQDSSMASRRIAPHIGEPAIKRHKQPLLILRSMKHDCITLPAEPFCNHSMDVVSRFIENRGGARRKVLVEFDLHASGPKVTTSSRARSAPYIRAAWIACSGRLGYSSRIALSLMPDATQSRITLTGICVPRMHACP